VLSQIPRAPRARIAQSRQTGRHRRRFQRDVDLSAARRAVASPGSASVRLWSPPRRPRRADHRQRSQSLRGLLGSASLRPLHNGGEPAPRPGRHEGRHPRCGPLPRRDTPPFEYHKDAAKTSQSRHPLRPNWTTTGDIGRLDEEGFLFLTDRKAFVIISGGVNIYPQEIENCLEMHPKVYDAAVIGVPDEEMGESVKAVVQPTDGAEPGTTLAEELRAAGPRGRTARQRRSQGALSGRQFLFDRTALSLRFGGGGPTRRSRGDRHPQSRHSEDHDAIGLC